MVYIVMEGNEPNTFPYWRKVMAVCRTKERANKLVKEFQQKDETSVYWHEPWQLK